MEQNNKNCIKKIVIFVSVFVVLIISTILIANYEIQKYETQKKEEKFNNDLKKVCYEVFEKEDFSEFKKFISTLKNDNKKEKAYTELKNELKENAEININNYEKSKKMLTVIEDELTNNKKDNEVRLNSILIMGQDLYTYNICLINGNKSIEDGDYYGAYRVFETAKNTIANTDKEKVNIIAKKQEDIYDKAKEDAKEFLVSRINSSEISSVDEHASKSTVKAYIDIVKDEELTKLYNEWNEKVETRKNEEDAKRLAEEKARKKQEGVRIGMSKQDVLDSSWGEPKKINTSIGSWGTHEQWVYGNGNYLYFENGKLTSIQN